MKKGVVLKPNCKDCGVPKTVESTYINPKGQYNGRCRKCITVQSRLYYSENKDKRASYYRETKEKIAAATKLYRGANKEKIASYLKTYNIINKEELRVNQKTYYEANKARIAASKKAYREANKEGIAASGKAHYEANKDKISARNKLYREANKEKIVAGKKAYREANKEKIAASEKAHYEANKDKISARNKLYREANKEKIVAGKKAYQENNKEKLNAYIREKLKRDPIFRLRTKVRSRIIKALNGTSKSESTPELLGCSIEVYRLYLEAQFEPGMTWETHSPKGWHIDHIRPCASFDLTDPQQQIECFHFSNTQPLWAKDNLSKGAKY